MINLYQIPASLSHGPYCSLTQYVRADGKIKTPITYRNEIFKEIKKHVNDEDITDIIIAGDYNQGICENAVR